VRDLVDVHVHSAPSLVPRHDDDRGTLDAARSVGITTVVLKAHEGSTAERAALLGPGAVGGVVLNSPVGGANPDAVTVAAALGGRVAWLPTISSPAHQAAERQPELTAHTGVRLSTVAVVVDGEVLPAWLEVFDAVAAAGMVLASGHLTMDETIVAFTAARRRGVERLLVNHPLLPFLDWRDEHGPALQAIGARLEVGVLADLLGGEGRTTEVLAASYPIDLLIFGSDLGHASYPTLPDGVTAWMARLTPVLGEEGIGKVMSTNARELLGP
jgi:hypothetical protein